MENSAANDIKKLHRNNLIVVWVGTLAMSGTTFISFGTDIKGLLALGTMVLSAIIGSLAYLFIGDDHVKGLVIITAPAVATLVYSANPPSTWMPSSLRFSHTQVIPRRHAAQCPQEMMGFINTRCPT